MAQHDMIIDNASGYVVRQDVNTALQALAGLSSGTNAPTMTYAYQWWADTTAGVLRQRNAGNTGWVVRGSLAEGVVVSRSSNAQLTISDYGKTIVATGTWTQTFASASALGNGWYAAIRNAGAGVITLDPSGSEQIDGLTTITLGAGEACLIYSNGTALHTVGRAPLVQPSAATSGTAPAYTLALLPAPTLSAGLRVRANFHAATTAAATLNVSGTGAKPIKQYTPTGAKVAARIAVGQRADVEYDGTDWVILDALPPAAPAQATQAEMEAGTETGVRSMSPENIAQAIEALASGGAAFERITASKTVTVPPGMTGARLFGCAGGGGGGYNTTAGSAGGSTSFGTYATATGGGGGGGGATGAGGAGGAGDFAGGSGGGGRAYGSHGIWGDGGKSSGSITNAGGGGGGSIGRGGDGAIGTGGTATAGMKGSGGGGGWPVSDGSGGYRSPGGGGGGGVIDTHVTGLTPGQQIVVTIGAGGAGAHSTAGGGADGYLDVLWTA